MPYAETGFGLYYERHGTGEPLLFISGFAESGAVFESVIARYAERFEVIVYDHRAAGRSAVPRGPTSIPQLAGDAAELLEALGIESAHVYGLSLGGMVAQELAIRHPERVRGLVLGCTTFGGPRAVLPTRSQWRALARAARRSARLPGRPWEAPILFSPEFNRDQPERALELLASFRSHRATPRGLTWHWWASFAHDTYRRLDRIRAPTLVVHGDRDALVPLENARLLSARIPDAEVAIVPGAGHAYLLERPEEAHRLFVEWLDRRGPIAAGPAKAGLAARMGPWGERLGLPLGLVRTMRDLGGVLRLRARRRRRARAEAAR